MRLEFDPRKDELNILKHAVSLTRAVELQVAIVIPDRRFEEERYRAYGWLDGKSYCLAYTFRGDNLRAISLRRVRRKEMRRYVR